MRGPAFLPVVNRGEDVTPGLEHFVRVVETLAMIPAQSLFKEADEAIPQIGVETFRQDGNFGTDRRRIDIFSFAPSRQHAGCHFVERHRGGEAFRADVPALDLALGDEGI